MSKKLAKIRTAITEGLENVESENILNAILTIVNDYGPGEEGEGSEDGEGGEDDASGSAYDLSGLKKKQLKAIAVAAKIKGAEDLDDKDAIIEALSELEDKKLEKAAGKAEVELPSAD